MRRGMSHSYSCSQGKQPLRLFSIVGKFFLCPKNPFPNRNGMQEGRMSITVEGTCASCFYFLHRPKSNKNASDPKNSLIHPIILLALGLLSRLVVFHIPIS